MSLGISSQNDIGLTESQELRRSVPMAIDKFEYKDLLDEKQASQERYKQRIAEQHKLNYSKYHANHRTDKHTHH